MKRYSLLCCMVAMSGFSYGESKESLQYLKKPKNVEKKSHHKKEESKNKEKKSLEKPKHYIYQKSGRPKKETPGVVVSGLSTQGNMLVPFSKNTAQEKHDGMMYLYDHTFHQKHGHITDLMIVLADWKSKKYLSAFKKSVNRIHESLDDWGALKDATESYDAFACCQVEIFENQRLAKKESALGGALQKKLRSLAHTQPELMFAAHKLAHSRLLLAQYAQDHRLDQCIASAEKSLKSKPLQKKFNTKDLRLVHARNRLVSLCILLEGAVVHYCAIQEALVSDMEKKSVPVQKAIDAIMKELQQTLLL